MKEKEAFNRLIRIMGSFDLATGHADTWTNLLDSLEEELRYMRDYLGRRIKELNKDVYAKPQYKELSDDEIFEVSNTMPYADRFEFARAILRKAQEK